MVDVADDVTGSDGLVFFYYTLNLVYTKIHA